jgi:death-on-curing protein
MEFENKKIEEECQRWHQNLGPDDPCLSDQTVGIHEVLDAHFLIVDYFVAKGYGLGGIGPRSLDLLHSAVARQFTCFEGTNKWKNPFEICATLLFGLIKNHPFYDGNKRSALLSSLLLLQKNKKLIKLPQRKLDAMVLAIAEDKVAGFLGVNFSRRKRDGGDESLRDDDATIKLIAEYLRKNTRTRDDSRRTVTFSDLNRILNRYGFSLESPSGNFINIVRVVPEKPGGVWGFGAKKEQRIYLAQVGFPGWKDQVSKAALKTIRETVKMTSKEGCDTKVFFDGAEPLNSLISEYSMPLHRLADK